MHEMHFETTIARAPEDVFALLIDLGGYGKWLSASGLYADTLNISDHPIKLGTTYVDQGQTLPMRGEITVFEPPERLGFHQTGQVKLLLFKVDIEVDIQYQLATVEGGTHVTRRVKLTTRHLPGFAEGILANAIRKEVTRLLAKMKAHLEARMA